MKLTIVDQEILKSYACFIEGIANYLGNGYEIVLHSLENYENSVIKIINGEHTGRVIGSPITNKALEMLDIFEKTGSSSETYFSLNKKGEPLKSTTIAIKGEGGRIIGLLCMNFYMNTSFSEVLKTFIPTEPITNMDDFAKKTEGEVFAENIDDMITGIFNSVKNHVLDDQSISASNKNKAIVAELDEKGIFKIKDSVTKVADLLGISKNTVYLHLRNNSQETE